MVIRAAPGRLLEGTDGDGGAEQDSLAQQIDCQDRKQKRPATSSRAPRICAATRPVRNTASVWPPMILRAAGTGPTSRQPPSPTVAGAGQAVRSGYGAGRRLTG